MSALFAQKRTT